jgi:hypothetical protein
MAWGSGSIAMARSGSFFLDFFFERLGIRESSGMEARMGASARFFIRMKNCSTLGRCVRGKGRIMGSAIMIMGSCVLMAILRRISLKARILPSIGAMENSSILAICLGASAKGMAKRFI